MDALSDVLRSVRMEGAVFLNAEFTGPWCVRSSFGLNNARQQLPDGVHVVFFHLLVEGACHVRMIGAKQAIPLAVGDMILFPHDDQHLLGSDLQRTPMLSANTLQGDARDGSQMVHLRLGNGEGESSRGVCGVVACARPLLRPLLDALPRMLHIPMRECSSAALLQELVRTGVTESTVARAGSASIRTRLAELLFAEAMRAYAERLPPDGRGWLAGLRDAHVGRALALLHADPGSAWTVDLLARKVGLSRSTLAERFAALVGKSPIQYLVGWRLALAAQALQADHGTIARIAERSGYESEASFSRAFKREFDMTPSAWRRHAMQ